MSSEVNKEGNKKEFFSITDRLLVLLVVMILPFIAFSIYKAVDIGNRSKTEAYDNSQILSKNIAHELDEYIIATGDVLISVAENDNIRKQNFAAAKPWLDRTIKKYPFYHLLAFVDPKGDMKFASMSEAMQKSQNQDAVKVRNKINVSDTACYRRGIVAPGVSVGDFMYSKITGMPVVHVTYPVFDFKGKRIGFMAAAFDLTKIQNKIMQTDIPREMEVSIIDDQGVIVATNKNPKKYVGQNVSKISIFKGLTGHKEGTRKAVFPDGTTRLSGFRQAVKVPWYAIAGIEDSYTQKEVQRELFNHFAVFLPLLLIAVFGWLWIGKDMNKLHMQTEQLSLIDPLTSLWNCRKLNQDIVVEISRAKRHREYLSFAMLDIDHFKVYNDNNGHQKGDKALRIVAEIIKAAVRDSDSVYRYGGEELCIVFPNTDKQSAHIVAERIRSDIEQMEFEGEEYQPFGSLTISIGVASYPMDSIAKEGLIKSADLALYKAKENGRNRVEQYGDEDFGHSRERDCRGLGNCV